MAKIRIELNNNFCCSQELELQICLYGQILEENGGETNKKVAQATDTVVQKAHSPATMRTYLVLVR